MKRVEWFHASESNIPRPIRDSVARLLQQDHRIHYLEKVTQEVWCVYYTYRGEYGVALIGGRSLSGASVR